MCKKKRRWAVDRLKRNIAKPLFVPGTIKMSDISHSRQTYRHTDKQQPIDYKTVNVTLTHTCIPTYRYCVAKTDDYLRK